MPSFLLQSLKNSNRVFPASVFRHLPVVCGGGQPQHEKSGAAGLVKLTPELSAYDSSSVLRSAA